MNSYIYCSILLRGARIVGWENDSVCIKTKYGGKAWFKNGQYHRENGPAIEGRDGNKAWYINGQRLTEKEFNQR